MQREVAESLRSRSLRIPGQTRCSSERFSAHRRNALPMLRGSRGSFYALARRCASQPVASGDFDPERLLAVLAAHGVDFVLIGGMAAVLHGDVGVTVDLDVVLQVPLGRPRAFFPSRQLRRPSGVAVARGHLPARRDSRRRSRPGRQCRRQHRSRCHQMDQEGRLSALGSVSSCV